MIEVKADGLEASFEALENEDDGVEALKSELALLKKRIDEGVIVAQRPALDGVKSVCRRAFVAAGQADQAHLGRRQAASRSSGRL